MKTITVEDEIWQKLTILKAEMKADSIGSVINSLLEKR